MTGRSARSGLRPRAVLVCGATASGKSKLAMKIAEDRDGIVINADAIQVYSCWRILTARPTPQDEARVPHALYGHVGKETRHSVGAWLQDVRRVLSSHPGRLPVLVGGTGLYFTALTEGLAPVPEIPAEIRRECAQLLKSDGIERLLGELRRADPETAGRIDTDNPARISRAWEVLRATGRGLSYWRRQHSTPLLPLDEIEPLLTCADPSFSFDRIDQRLRQMIADGVLEECATVFRDWDPSLPYAKALGARQFKEHLEGGAGLDETLSRVAAATRQYAKRQRTWFRSRMASWKNVPAVPDHGHGISA